IPIASVPSMCHKVREGPLPSPGTAPGFRRDCGGRAAEFKRAMAENVSFGDHRFDVATGRLWTGAKEIRLTPKASAVLKQLVMHAGTPVSKDDLFASVWGGTIVTDDALTSCIQELRRALEDDA